MTNTHEERARLQRAWKLADVLQHAGETAAGAEEMAIEQWEMAAAVAGITPPSSETREMALELLRLREGEAE